MGFLKHLPLLGCLKFTRRCRYQFSERLGGSKVDYIRGRRVGKYRNNVYQCLKRCVYARWIFELIRFGAPKRDLLPIQFY